MCRQKQASTAYVSTRFVLRGIGGLFSFAYVYKYVVPVWDGIMT